MNRLRCKHGLTNQIIKPLRLRIIESIEVIIYAIVVQAVATLSECAERHR